ncbi:MAG: hypothetical protein R3217_00460 [Gammaproteobacteria bacterium]|nr:hypothetical protein [Gammaproteobacteria bacterium]
MMNCKKQMTVGMLMAFLSMPAMAVPGTDLWRVDIDLDANPAIVGEPEQLTTRPGYDNQPYFEDEGTLLYTRMDDSGQSDAYRLVIGGGTTPVRKTSDSEYSPQLNPAGEITVVQVDPANVQRLAVLKEGDNIRGYEAVFPNLEGVGYQAWLDASRVGLFLIRESAELHVANRDSGEVIRLAENIGRCIVAVPGVPGSMYFSEPDAGGKYAIKRLDVDARKITRIAPHVGSAMDYAPLRDGRILMADRFTLKLWDGAQWQVLKEFKGLPGEITRLAVSPSGKQLVFVAAE